MKVIREPQGRTLKVKIFKREANISQKIHPQKGKSDAHIDDKLTTIHVHKH